MAHLWQYAACNCCIHSDTRWRRKGKSIPATTATHSPHADQSATSQCVWSSHLRQRRKLRIDKPDQSVSDQLADAAQAKKNHRGHSPSTSKKIPTGKGRGSQAAAAPIRSIGPMRPTPKNGLKDRTTAQPVAAGRLNPSKPWPVGCRPHLLPNSNVTESRQIDLKS